VVVGLTRTHTFLAERYRRLSRRRGKKRALVAVGNSVLTIVWHLLSDPAAREGNHRVAFWLEYDNTTESHTRLLDKVRRYAEDLPARVPEVAGWPVLFSLNTFARETAFQERLAASYPGAKVATIARDGWGETRRSPADGPWWLHSDGPPRRRLIDLRERGGV
jgi:hypothetical protein